MKNLLVLRRLLSSNTFIKIGFNLGVQSIGKIINVLLSLATIVLITRYLGSAEYGIFALAFAYVSFISVISDLGLQLVMVRDLSQKDHNSDTYGTFLFLKIFLILLGSVVGIIALQFFPYSLTEKIAILIAIVAVALSGITNYGTAIFQSRVRLDLVTYIDVLSKLTSVILILFFASKGLCIYYMVLAVLFGNLIGLFATFVNLKDKFKLKFDTKRAIKVAKASIPIGVMLLVGLLYFKVDTILLSILKSSSEVGIYSLSFKVLENFLVLWGFYMAIIFPMISMYAGKNGNKKVAKLLKNSILISIISSTLIVGIVFIFAPYIIQILGGRGFAESTPVLRILIFSIPFLFINSLISDLCIALRSTKIIFIGITSSVFINVMLNIMFIPAYGAIGAAYVTVVSAALLTLYSVFVLMSLKIPFRK